MAAGFVRTNLFFLHSVNNLQLVFLLVFLRVQGGPDVTDHQIQNEFYGVLLKMGLRSCSNFLPYHKISILAKVIAG